MVIGKRYPGLRDAASPAERFPTSVPKSVNDTDAATFVVIYAFATPIGAVLTLHLLMRPTHSVPRALGAVTISAI